MKHSGPPDAAVEAGPAPLAPQAPHAGPASLTFRMPLPPPLSACFINLKGGGRSKSTRYRKWITDAGWIVQAAVNGQQIKGPISVSVIAGIPSNHKSDGDNRWKGILDLLSADTSHGLGIIETDDWSILKHHEWLWVEGRELEGALVTVKRL